MNSLDKIKKIKNHLLKQAEVDCIWHNTTENENLKKERCEIVELATLLEIELEK